MKKVVHFEVHFVILYSKTELLRIYQGVFYTGFSAYEFITSIFIKRINCAIKLIKQKDYT